MLIMDKNKKNLQMRLISILEVKFFMDQSVISNIANDKKIQLGFSNTVFPDETNNTIAIDFGVQYSYMDKLALECVYKFTFEVYNLNEYIEKNNDNSLTIKNIMPHMLSVAAGTMRGIILVKSFGTNLAKYPLPMLDIMQLNKNLSHLNK